MNLADLIDKSETELYAKTLLDLATQKAFGDRKPLIEILDKLKEEDNGLNAR